ncbi:hypothetical protein [Longimicrobium sp.]|uniref:hypothetical protein n=1 Tax=Longimicrobium sp. TaxID=2029185 RepID=UPI002C042716|nr:hypothetical protein [Longimicrobium sp.]HSU13441.1 hypothetical protein [Longimicrobium sp.]
MVSITHADIDELTEDEVRIPAGGRWMEMDWECVARAFQAASEKVGWDADIVLTPERQHALVRFPRERAELVGSTTLEFYCEVERCIGVEAFMSIWIDFLSKA